MTFDIEAFKNAAVHDAQADRYTALPTGDYMATITDAVIGNGGERDDGSAWAAYDIKADVLLESGRTRNVKLGFVLSVVKGSHGGWVPAGGDNTNVLLGQLRTAIGNNKPGQVFNWFDPIGHTVMVVVGHRSDKNDAEKVYEKPLAWRAA